MRVPHVNTQALPYRFALSTDNYSLEMVHGDDMVKRNLKGGLASGSLEHVPSPLASQQSTS